MARPNGLTDGRPRSEGLSARPAAWPVAAALLAAALAAPPLGATIIEPEAGEEFVFQEKSGKLVAGLHITNLSASPAKVEVDFLGGPALGKDQKVQGGYVLLDGTLGIGSEIPSGKVRAQIRVGYDGKRVRDLGLDEARLRLMRLRDGSDTWVRARRAVRADVNVRFLRDVRADGILGHFGIDREKQIVWGVLDVTSKYAIGALAKVPEPVSYALVIAGLALVTLGTRGRRMRSTRLDAA